MTSVERSEFPPLDPGELQRDREGHAFRAGREDSDKDAEQARTTHTETVWEEEAAPPTSTFEKATEKGDGSKGKEPQRATSEEGLATRSTTSLHEGKQSPPPLATIPPPPPPPPSESVYSPKQREHEDEAWAKVKGSKAVSSGGSALKALQHGIAQRFSSASGVSLASQEGSRDVPLLLSRSGYSLALTGSLVAVIAALIAMIDGLRAQGVYDMPMNFKLLHVPLSLQHVNVPWAMACIGAEVLVLALVLALLVLDAVPLSLRGLHAYTPLIALALAALSAGITGLLGVFATFLCSAAAVLSTAAYVAERVEHAATQHTHEARGKEELLHA